MPSEPWSNLAAGEAKRVHELGRHHFFWVRAEEGEPALALKLTSRPDPLPVVPKLRNLNVSFRLMGESPAFFITLVDCASIDIFESLCRNIVNAAEQEQNESRALSVAIQRTLRWQQLLSEARGRMLTTEAQRGLVAELSFLKELATLFDPLTAIQAWRGPYEGSPKDFELEKTCIEIKSRRPASNPLISISSEQQLSDVPGSRLFLRVTLIIPSADPKAKDLHQHVREAESVFREHAEAWHLWQLAIDETSYRHTDDYGYNRWVTGTSVDYEIQGEFPRITAPLAAGIQRVNYSLQLEACEPYKTSEPVISILAKEDHV